MHERHVREVLANADLHMSPLGFIDDDASKKGKTLGGYPVFGTLGDLETLIAADRANLPLDFRVATGIDLAGRIPSKESTA